MNIIDLQERLKDLPEEALMQEMQMPTGSAPQFLVLSELKRRKRMRDDYQRMQASDMKTVAEETITAAGMPQSGIMGVAQAMAPKSAIAQDTGFNDMQQMDPTQAPQPEQPMMMADGGYVRYMQGGGYPSTEVQQTRSILASDPGTQILAARMGMTVEEYIESLSPEARALNIQRIAEGRRREGEVRADVFDPAVPVLDQVSSDLSDFEPKDPSSLLKEKILSDYGGVNPSDKISSGVYGASKPDVFPGDRSVFEMDEEYNRAKEQERLDAAVLDEMSKDRGLTEREPSFMQDVVPFLGDFAGATYDAVMPKRENIAETLSGGVKAYTDALLHMAGESEGKELPMDTGTPLEIPEDGVGSSPPPARQEVAPDIATSDAGTGTGAGAGGAGFGSLDSRIAQMLAQRQKQAESDKWMALAYAGMEMMKPTSTIGEGLGAAGQAGLAYLQQSRKGLQDFETDMLKLQAEMDIANRRLAAGGSKSGALTLNQYLSRGEDLITAGQKMLEAAGDNADAAERGQDLINRGMALIQIATGGGAGAGATSQIIKTPSAAG